MYIANYHTHTARCKHAVGTDREYVERAIEAGLRTLGFSDHAPYAFPDGHVSPIRMDVGQLEDYVASLSALRTEYRNDISILIGYEAEFFPALFDGLLAELDVFGFDYLILGQHFLETEGFDNYAGRGLRDGAFLTRYADLIIAGMETGRFLFLAHPDLLHFAGDPETYRTQNLRICRRAKELNIPLEINMQGYRENRGYPSETFFRIAAEAGCTVVIGADAHSPDAVADLSACDGCRAFAAKLGLTVADTLPVVRKL